jgi:Carboxypeptidase regulatory-like domain
MRSLLVGFLFLFLSSPQAGKAVIEGIVRASGADAPLAGVQITAFSAFGGGTSVSATTNADGRFTLTLNPGEYRMIASRPGFVNQEYGQRSPTGPGTMIAVAAGQRYANAIFQLTPTGTITGRVFDPEGRTMEGATVTLSRLSWTPGGQRILQPAAFNRYQSGTNDLGEYRLYWIPPGDYYLSARDNSGIVISGPVGVRQKYATTFYPGVTDFTQASPMTVPPGVELGGINLILSRTKTTRVRGRLVSPAADTADSVTIVDMSPEDDRAMMDRPTVTFDDHTKMFTAMNVPPGRYRVRAALRIPNRYNLSGETMIDVAEEPVENATLAVVPSKTVTGQIEPAEAQFSPAVREAIDKKELHISLMPDSGNSAFLATSGEVGSDAKFVMRDVGVVHYRFNVLGMPPDAYIASARLGGTDVLQKGFALNGGDPPGPFVVTVSGLGGRINGVVRSSENQIVPAGRVVLVPEPDKRDRSDLFKIATLDQYGRFNMQGITPGRYKLFAWEDVPIGAYYDPDFLQSYEAQAKPVTVEKNDYIQAEITLTQRTTKRVQLSEK